MTAYTAQTQWQRQGAVFTDNRYSRAHRLRFDGGLDIPGSSSPHSVRLPYSDPAALDPEEALIAALSSCHMLCFLYLAAKAGYVVDEYLDQAEGVLETPPGEAHAYITQVTLKPAIRFSGAKRPDDAVLAELHHRAHDDCALAHSVKAAITLAGSWAHNG